MSYTETYDVVGMTCDHCARAVTTEVGALAGVSEVQVDLQSGHVRFIAHQAVPVAAVREAVEEAGYALA
jgi:copper chaperone CopZ